MDGTTAAPRVKGHPAWMWLLCAAPLAAGLAIDLLTPLGAASLVVYLAAILTAMQLPRHWAPLVIAAIATGLVGVGYLLSPPDEQSHITMANRALAVVALWSVALALHSREKVADAYRQVAESLRKAQSVAHIGSYELDIPTGQYRWSEEVFRIMGREASEGTPTLAKYLDEIVHSDDRARVGRQARRTRQSGEGFDHDYRIVRPDGTVRYVQSVGATEPGSGGEPGRIIGTLLDITERKMAEEALTERERRLQSIIETAPEGVITIDERGAIESFSASAERLFGYGAEEVIGHNVSMLMPSPDREHHDEYIARYLRTGERRIIGIGRLVEGLRKDGGTFPMELAVGEIELSGRHIFTGFVRDVTYRRKMERELQQAQKMEAIGQLTGGIAHDFNNLLTVITGNLEMLDSRLRDAEQRVLLTDAIDAADLGAQLTGRLLAFGRRQPLEPHRVNLGDIVEDMQSILYRTLGETIEVRTPVGARTSDCIVDPGQIENVILNLAINARDAMPDGGRLTIEVAETELDADYLAQYPDVRQGRYVLLAVTDTGTGMTPDVRDRAFEPFFTTKASGAGNGLGLSTTYGFVKQSGGHIRLYSEPGLGTSVAIYLPPADALTARAEASPALLPESETGRGETVLVVEDDARVRRVSVAHLKELGYQVLEAADGHEAVALLDAGPTMDVLFTDMVMPGGLSGSEVAEKARACSPQTRVLFTSGYAEPDIVRRSVGDGASWLRKPYTKAALARKLRELLDGDAGG